jgi:hypothetical protein
MAGLGDAPISEEYRRKMNTIAVVLDGLFNDEADPKHTGFVLLVFPFGEREGRCNYISNAERADVVVLLKEQLARFEGQPEMEGHA